MKNRARTQVARVGDAKTVPIAYEFAGFRLEPARRALTQPGGTPARLSGKPFDTLVYLVEHAGELVDRDELLRAVWPKRVIEDNNLNQAIAMLRRVLGEEHVATVAGRGYQFVTPVRQVLPPSAAAADSAPSSAHAASAETAAGAALEAAERAAQRRGLRWPIFVAAAAAGVAVVALLALTPQRSARWSLVGAPVSVQPLTGYPGEELTPALSPDGTRVAFSWRGPEGSRNIYVTQVGIAKPFPLSDGGEADDVSPAWSPDGTQIAFLRRHDAERFDVMVMPALGGDARRQYGGRMYWISVEGSPLLAWTPDGKHLLFTTRRAESSADDHGLHRLTLATGKVEDVGLGDQAPFYDTSPAVSPDGRWLAFTHYTRGQRLNQIMLQRLDGDFAAVGPPQPALDIEPDIYHSLHWSPSGDRLWFSNGSQIFEWGLAGSPRVVHTLGEAKDVAPVPARTAIGLTVTLDGREVLYAAVGGTPEADILLLEFGHPTDR